MKTDRQFSEKLRKKLGDQFVLALLALVVGAAAGAAVIGFREGISLVQEVFYGSGDHRLFLQARELAWWRLLLAPSLGGVLVGLLTYYFMAERRPRGVADVIEASSLRNGRMSLTTGLRGALVNAASLGVGASTGREGPAVHLGAALGGWLAKFMNFPGSLSRTLLGCGAASAVAASFNAPIAGFLFANEVVLGHYGTKALAPLVISSVTGTAISRAYFGGFPAFEISEHVIASYWEIPAFAVLGVFAAMAAAALIQGVKLAGAAAEKVPGPPWLRPGLAGLAVGAMAIALPQVLGVGYGATEAMLAGAFSLSLLAALCLAKIAATSICLGFGFGGGVFSPSLVIGAALGGAFGIIITALFPGMQLTADAYTIAGMGAVAAAVLGAPISTTLIVFEMTGDYALTMGVMVAVVVATALFGHFRLRSFFHWQLSRRGIDLIDGFERTLLCAVKVGDVMSADVETAAPGERLTALRVKLGESSRGVIFVKGDDGRFLGAITLADLGEAAFCSSFNHLIVAQDVARKDHPALTLDDNLETALDLLRASPFQYLAIVKDSKSMRLAGCVGESRVMAAYNKALLERRREERG